MQLKATGIDHLNLNVKNLNKSVQFYKDLFGFEILKEQPEQNSKIIGNDKIKLCLYEDEEFSGYRESGFNHFGFHVGNFGEVINKCRDFGVKINYGGTVEWEKSESVYIEDPDGYEIELSRVFGGGL